MNSNAKIMVIISNYLFRNNKFIRQLTLLNVISVEIVWFGLKPLYALFALRRVVCAVCVMYWNKLSNWIYDWISCYITCELLIIQFAYWWHVGAVFGVRNLIVQNIWDFKWVPRLCSSFSSKYYEQNKTRQSSFLLRRLLASDFSIMFHLCYFLHIFTSPLVLEFSG